MPIRRLGYVIHRDDGKLDVGYQSVQLPEDAWEEFERVVAITADIRPFVVDFVSLELDFERLERVEVKLAQELVAKKHPLAGIGISHIHSLAEAQGAISNFLSSASAFRDRLKSRLRAKHGESSEEYKWILQHETTAYDGWFAYRLLYNLRNYGQHHEMPVSLIPITAQRNSLGQFDAVAQILISPMELMESPLIQKRFREKELVTRTEDIALMPLARQYLDLHGMMLNAVAQLHLPRILEFQAYVQRIIVELKLPIEATPMIFEGEDISNPRFFHFSIDEFKYLRALTARLKLPAAD